jgi:hypothetical protein
MFPCFGRRAYAVVHRRSGVRIEQFFLQAFPRLIPRETNARFYGWLQDEKSESRWNWAAEPAAMVGGIGVFATGERDHAFAMPLPSDALDSGRDLHR